MGYYRYYLLGWFWRGMDGRGGSRVEKVAVYYIFKSNLVSSISFCFIFFIFTIQCTNKNLFFICIYFSLNHLSTRISPFIILSQPILICPLTSQLIINPLTKYPLSQPSLPNNNILIDHDLPILTIDPYNKIIGSLQAPQIR